MKQDVIIYVEGLLRETKQVLEQRIRDRATAKPYPERTMHVLTEKNIREHLEGRKSANWIIIPGLRGVGKSTLLAQLYLKLLRAKEAGIASYKDILLIHFSLDEVATIQSNIREVLEAYEKLIGINISTSKNPVFIFLDEVHYDPTWTSTLKIIHDKNPNVFIVCTGSSAISLQANTDESRRISIQRLYPASFAEHVMMRYGRFPTPAGLKAEIKKVLWASESAIDVFSRLKHLEPKVNDVWGKIPADELLYYLIRGSIPFASALPDEQDALGKVQRTIESIIKIDLPLFKNFDNKTLKIIMPLLWKLANAGDISLRGLSTELQIDEKTLASILDSLEKTELIIKLLPFSESRNGRLGMKITTKPNKYLFMSPTMRAAILNAIGGRGYINEKIGYLLEDAVGLYFYKELMERHVASVMYIKDDSNLSADFIVEYARSFIPVEVSWTDNKKCSQVLSSMNEIDKCKYGLVLCNCSDLELVQDRAVKIPLKFFLFS